MNELEKFGNFFAISAQVFNTEEPSLVLMADVPTIIIGFLALKNTFENSDLLSRISFSPPNDSEILS